MAQILDSIELSMNGATGIATAPNGSTAITVKNTTPPINYINISNISPNIISVYSAFKNLNENADYTIGAYMMLSLPVKGKLSRGFIIKFQNVQGNPSAQFPLNIEFTNESLKWNQSLQPSYASGGSLPSGVTIENEPSVNINGSVPITLPAGENLPVTVTNTVNTNVTNSSPIGVNIENTPIVGVQEVVSNVFFNTSVTAGTTSQGLALPLPAAGHKRIIDGITIANMTASIPSTPIAVLANFNFTEYNGNNNSDFLSDVQTPTHLAYLTKRYPKGIQYTNASNVPALEIIASANISLHVAMQFHDI